MSQHLDAMPNANAYSVSNLEEFETVHRGMGREIYC
jgi:hypothetical protein